MTLKFTRYFFSLLIILLHTSFTAEKGEQSNHQLFFLIQHGQVRRAINLYEQSFLSSGEHDFHLLQEMGISLLEVGAQSSNPEEQLVSLFGAGISLNEKTLHILEKGMRSPTPQLQLVSLNFLSKYHNKDAEKSIESALRSDFLPIRLEAAFHLCLIKHPHASAQAESLMHKLPPELLPLFPQLFAANGTPSSLRTLKQMLSHPNPQVRIQAVNSVLKFQRDELLPMIRILLSHHDIAQQEACAQVLGDFGDEESLPRLKELAKAKAINVRLSATRSLYQLGQRNIEQSLFTEARKGNLFAINLLGFIPNSEDTLFLLTKHPDINIRVNAAFSLLERQDIRALQPLVEVFIKDSRDLAFLPTHSIGHSLIAWKVVPSSSQNFKETPVNFTLSLGKREDLLVKTADLPEKGFLSLAELIFRREQNDLVPLLVQLLENIQSEDSIALLKKYSQKAGAPLIRNYCNLALYRLGEEGPYYDNLKSWIISKSAVDLIRLRPPIPFEKRAANMPYQMTPDEESRLLVESFESFVKSQDDRGIGILLQSIRDGNVNNKYILAGLLIRATL